MKIGDLLEIYYRGFARKSGWDTVISDDFEFTGGNHLARSVPLIGKPAYQQIIARYSRLFTDMSVTDTLVAGDRAVARVRYEYAFPNGKVASGDVIECWTIRNGALSSLTIFFDTAGFEKLIS